jgi:hypothetical protein
MGQAITRWAGLEHRWVWSETSDGTASTASDHWEVVTTTPTGPEQVELEHSARILEISVEKFFCSFSKSSSTR